MNAWAGLSVAASCSSLALAWAQTEVGSDTLRSSSLSIAAVANGAADLRVTVVPQATCVLEESRDLARWVAVAVVGSGQTLFPIETPKEASAGFFRLSVLGTWSVGTLPGSLDLRRDFGGVGDGLADDTAALQRAFDRLGTSLEGTVLYVPPGTYRLTSRCVLRGDPKAPAPSAILLGRDPDTTVFLWDGPPDAAVLEFEGCTPQVGGLAFAGEYAAGTLLRQPAP